MDSLAQLTDDRLFITDGGLETSMIFHHGLDLPSFAAFDLLDKEAGRKALREYFENFFLLAHMHDVGLLLDTVTWRANRDWGELLGYSPEALAAVNRSAVDFARELRNAHEDQVDPILISGCVGPRGDAYAPELVMSADDAARYHATQVAVLAESGVDLITALTLTYPAEAVGIVRAAQAHHVPVVISFTVETDGRLPSGDKLRDAIEEVDAETSGGAAYFMVNCAHPEHFATVLDEDGPWRDRIRGIRANASKKSHAELDASDELDDGDPVELAAGYVVLSERLKLAVVGGCCGTDHRHVGEACAALSRSARARPVPGPA